MGCCESREEEPLFNRDYSISKPSDINPLKPVKLAKSEATGTSDSNASTHEPEPIEKPSTSPRKRHHEPAVEKHTSDVDSDQDRDDLESASPRKIAKHDFNESASSVNTVQAMTEPSPGTSPDPFSISSAFEPISMSDPQVESPSKTLPVASEEVETSTSSNLEADNFVSFAYVKDDGEKKRRKKHKKYTK